MPSKESATCSVLANSVGWTFGFLEGRVQEGMDLKPGSGELRDIASEIGRFLSADCFEPGFARDQLDKMAREAIDQDAGSLEDFSQKVDRLFKENIKDSN